MQLTPVVWKHTTSTSSAIVSAISPPLSSSTVPPTTNTKPMKPLPAPATSRSGSKNAAMAASPARSGTKFQMTCVGQKKSWIGQISRLRAHLIGQGTIQVRGQ